MTDLMQSCSSRSTRGQCWHTSQCASTDAVLVSEGSRTLVHWFSWLLSYRVILLRHCWEPHSMSLLKSSACIEGMVGFQENKTLVLQKCHIKAKTMALPDSNIFTLVALQPLFKLLIVLNKRCTDFFAACNLSFRGMRWLLENSVVRCTFKQPLLWQGVPEMLADIVKYAAGTYH